MGILTTVELLEEGTDISVAVLSESQVGISGHLIVSDLLIYIYTIAGSGTTTDKIFLARRDDVKSNSQTVKLLTSHGSLVPDRGKRRGRPVTFGDRFLRTRPSPKLTFQRNVRLKPACV
jgi:hypothetical protein